MNGIVKVISILILVTSLFVSVNAQKSILSGTVYDANGAVVPDTKVLAINENGEKFETLTNDAGVYVLVLPISKYDAKKSADFKIAKYKIVVDRERGFERFVLTDFKFVPSYKGKMILDIALDVYDSNCGAGGCLPEIQFVEIKKPATSNKILPRPLEKLPKAQNKLKRKNKNNK